MDPSIRISPRARSILPWIAIPAISFAWFWFFRSQEYSGGDSEQYTREVSQGLWFRKRQMLSFALLRLAYIATHAAWGWTAELAFSLVSCLAGAAAMLIVWRMFAGRRNAAVSFVVVASGGFAAIFHGHIETYALPLAALFLHLLAVQRSSENRWPIWTLPATFLLAMLLHLVALFALPALAAVTALEIRRRGIGARDLAVSGACALGGIAFWIALQWAKIGHGELEGGGLIHPMSSLAMRPWLVFSQDEFVRAKAGFVWVNAGMTFALMPWVYAARVNDRATRHELLYFLCFVNFFLVWSPFAGERDWDLFSFPWAVGTVTLARWLLELRARAMWLGLALGSNFFLWIARPFHFAHLGERDHGTIVFENRSGQEILRALIDDRVPLERENRYLPAGGHSVTLLVRGGKPIRRIVRIEPGRTYEMSLEEDGVRIGLEGGGGEGTE